MLGLGVTGMLSPAHAETDSVLSLSVNSHSNIPNALAEPNVFGDNFADVNYRINRYFVTSPGNRLSIGAELGARQYLRTQGLESILAGLNLAYSHRAGLGPYAPRFNVGLSLNRVEFSESLRDSWVRLLSLSVSKRLTPEWLLNMGVNSRQRHAQPDDNLIFNPRFGSDVFTQHSQEFTARLEYTLLNASAVTIGYRYRQGEIDASSRPGTPLLNITKAIARDAGIGKDYVTYLLNADTQGLSLDWNIPLARDTGLTLGFERLLSRANQGNKYFNNNLRAEFNVRF